MSKSVIDLTPAELDKLARDAWSDAARQASARGLAVSGSRDGRRFRYHPDRRMEDLGPVGGLLASDPTFAMNVESPRLHFQGDELPEAYREMAEVKLFQAADAYRKATAEVQAATIFADLTNRIGEDSRMRAVADRTDPFSAPVVPFEIPEQMRAFAEKGVAQARDSYAKFRDAAETHNGIIEAVFSTAGKGASEYSAKLMEMMKANTTATLDFAEALIGVKSPNEALELWTSHAKKQFETFTAHTRELAELTQRIAEKTKAHRDAKDGNKDSSVA